MISEALTDKRSHGVSDSLRGEIAYALTKRLVIDMPTARAAVDEAVDSLTTMSAYPSPETNVAGSWLPIEQADKTITNVQEFPEAGITIKTSDRYWVRDEDGRVYEAAWSEGKYGRNYWWDFEGESPVDPVEFMPHPLDPRWSATTEGAE